MLPAPQTVATLPPERAGLGAWPGAVERAAPTRPSLYRPPRTLADSRAREAQAEAQPLAAARLAVRSALRARRETRGQPEMRARLALPRGCEEFSRRRVA